MGVGMVGLLGLAGALTSALLVRASGTPVNELSILAVLTAYTVVAVIISLARPGHPVGRLMLFGTCLWGLGEGLYALAIRAVDQGNDMLAGWFAVFGSLRGPGWLLLVLAVPTVFPDGHLPWRGRWPVAVVVTAIGLLLLGLLLAPTPLDDRLQELDSPTGLPANMTVVAEAVAIFAIFMVLIALVVAMVGLVHRWRTGDELLRQRLLWFFTAFALPLLLIPLIPTNYVQPWMFALVTVPVPIAIGVSLFQDRLYDVHLVVNRTVTYVALSVVVAGLYAATVGGVGVVLDDRGASWLPWVGAGVVAVAFAPLRNVLQHWVNRFTYGQWSEPADVLTSTGRRLGDAADVPGLLRTMTEELGFRLGLEYVEITNVHGRSLAVHGTPQQPFEETPLTAYGQTVGSLRVSPPRLRGSDRHLLQDLATQIGGVVHSAGLVDALRESQEGLVRAREEERRRLRRDLHDGLGSALAGLTLQVDTVRNLVAAGADADADLLHLRGGVASTVLDVRRIVEGLRPPALDELGLDGALRQLVERTTRGLKLGVEVSMPDELPDIPAAVEVAAYRVAQEALTNAVRHSGADLARLVLDVTDAEVRLEVADNGSGEVRARPGGIGLTTMYERAAEIGGRLSIKATDCGTTITLWLPRSTAAPS